MEHRALIAHINHLARLFIVRNRSNTNGLNLDTALLQPLGIQSVAHVLRQLAHLGGDLGNADSVHAHLVDGNLQRLQELVLVLFLDVVNVYERGITWNRLSIELQRVDDANGIGAVSPQEQLSVIEVVKVLHRVRSTELNALNLLQIDVKSLLRPGRSATELKTIPSLFQRIAQAPGKQRRRRTGIKRVRARLGGKVHNLARISNQQGLTIINQQLRSVSDDVLGAALVRPAPALAHLDALGKDDTFPHVLCGDGVHPLVRKCSADSACCRLNQAHVFLLMSVFSTVRSGRLADNPADSSLAFTKNLDDLTPKRVKTQPVSCRPGIFQEGSERSQGWCVRVFTHLGVRFGRRR